MWQSLGRVLAPRADVVIRIGAKDAELLRELLGQEIGARRSEAERYYAIATNRIMRLKEPSGPGNVFREGA